MSSASREAPGGRPGTTWEDLYREHREWCSIHVTCIVCNVAEERKQDLLWAMARLKLEAMAAAEHEGDIHDRCTHVGGGCHVKKQ